MKKSLPLKISTGCATVTGRLPDENGGSLETFGDRLRHLRQTLEMPQSEIANACGVTCQAVTSWEQGRNGATIHNLLIVQRKTACDLHWLITGERLGRRLKPRGM